MQGNILVKNWEISATRNVPAARFSVAPAAPSLAEAPLVALCMNTNICKQKERWREHARGGRNQAQALVCMMHPEPLAAQPGGYSQHIPVAFVPHHLHLVYSRKGCLELTHPRRHTSQLAALPTQSSASSLLPRSE